jgi:hypothetical protein
MDALKKKAASAASTASEKAKTAGAAAAGKAKEAGSAAAEKAKESGVLEKAKTMVPTEGVAGKGMDFLKAGLEKAFVPSAELQNFIKNPTAQDLQNNPAMVLEGLKMMQAAKHPRAAAMSGLFAEGVERAASGASAAADAGAKVAVQSQMDKAAGGPVPPEVSKAAIDFAKNNPDDFIKIMKMLK